MKTIQVKARGTTRAGMRARHQTITHTKIRKLPIIINGRVIGYETIIDKKDMTPK